MLEIFIRDLNQEEEEQLQKFGQETERLFDLISKGAYKKITNEAFPTIFLVDSDYLVLGKILAVQEARRRIEYALGEFLQHRKNMKLSSESQSGHSKRKLEAKIGKLNLLEEELIESLSEE